MIDLWRTRSYNACLREDVGVSGTVSASEPVCPEGVEGTEEVGVEKPDRDGDIDGVCGPNRSAASSARDLRVDGV